LNFPAKTEEKKIIIIKKKKKKKKHTNHHNSKELGEDQPPPVLLGEQNSTALLAERKTNLHSLKTREGQKTQAGRREPPSPSKQGSLYVTSLNSHLFNKKFKSTRESDY
jgi:hypothetical protein